MSAELAAPFIPCRCCNQPCDVQWQSSWKGGGFWLVTCWRDDCPLAKQTLSESDYDEIDLGKYSVFALEALNTGDVFQWAGGISTVIHTNGEALWLHDEGYEGGYELPFSAVTAGVWVKVTGRCKVAAATIQRIERRDWRECIGE